MDSHETTNPLMIEFVSLSSDVLLWVNIIRYTIIIITKNDLILNSTPENRL